MICGQREVRVLDESKRDERKTEGRVGRSGEPPAAGDVVLGSPCVDPPPSSRPRRSPYWFKPRSSASVVLLAFQFLYTRGRRCPTGNNVNITEAM